MNLNIRKIEETDIPNVIELMREFAEFENLTDSFRITAQQFQTAMFGENAVLEGLIASDGDTPIGFALFYPNFSSFRGQLGFFLEDLYIKPEHRGNGVGEAMLRELAQLAIARGFERIDFHVLDWNTPAIKFYKKLGAVRDDDERHFKFNDAAFASLSS